VGFPGVGKTHCEIVVVLFRSCQGGCTLEDVAGGMTRRLIGLVQLARAFA